MKATISKLDYGTMDMKPVGTIQTLGGKAVASAGAKPFMLDELTDPYETGAIVTPDDGDKYVAALPAQYDHSSYINADLESTTEGD